MPRRRHRAEAGSRSGRRRPRSRPQSPQAPSPRSIVGVGGGLLKSTDGGATFAAVESWPNIRIDLSRHGSARSQRGLCRRLQDDRRRSHLERLAAPAWPHDGRRSHEFERGVHGFRRRGKESIDGGQTWDVFFDGLGGTHLFAVDRSFPPGRALRRHQRQRGASLHRWRGHLELDRRTGNERVVGPRRPG